MTPLRVPLLSLFLATSSYYLFTANAEYMHGNVNILQDNGFSFLGHWMFGHNTGNATANSWRFDKFKAGTLDITLRLHKPLEVETIFELALYDDQPESWPLLLANKSNACYVDSSGDYRINKTMLREHSNILFRNSPIDGNDTWSATINIHEHIVPRWWWAYLVKCDYLKTPAGDFVKNDIEYKLHWTQANVSPWHTEISLNEQYQNTFHCVTPWFSFSLFCIQCIAHYLYWKKGVPKGYVHPIVNLLTALLFLYFISQIFELSYWLHLTKSGYKEFGILTFAFLFEISASIIFQYLLIAMLGFGWRMSVMFDLVVYVWSYQYYPDEEQTLYRYSEDPQVVYGVFMLICGLIFFIICVYGSFRDSLNGIITNVQRNFRIMAGFCFLWSWFLWPMIAVGASETFGNDRTDFACDVISWCMKMASFFAIVMMGHPVNPYHERCFDFSKTFVHARYVKNAGLSLGDDSDDNDSGDANEYGNDLNDAAGQRKRGKKAMQMTEFKRTKKDNSSAKKQLFKYGGRNQIGQDSDDDESDFDDDDSSDDQDDDHVGHRVKITAVSMDGAKETQ